MWKSRKSVRKFFFWGGGRTEWAGSRSYLPCLQAKRGAWAELDYSEAAGLVLPKDPGVLAASYVKKSYRTKIIVPERFPEKIQPPGIWLGNFWRHNRFCSSKSSRFRAPKFLLEDLKGRSDHFGFQGTRPPKSFTFPPNNLDKWTEIVPKRRPKILPNSSKNQTIPTNSI